MCVCACALFLFRCLPPHPPNSSAPNPIFISRCFVYLFTFLHFVDGDCQCVCVCVRACGRMYDAVVCNLSKKVLPARVKVGGPQKGLLEASGGNNSPSQGQQHGGRARLLAARVLGDGLGALADGVLGQLAWQQEADGCLDLPTGDGRALVVVSQTRGFGSDALEDIIDKTVHDGHGFAADTRVGVHLLQHLVDVDGIAFLPFPLALLVAGANGLGLAGLLGALGADFGRHACRLAVSERVTTARALPPAIYTKPCRLGVLRGLPLAGRGGWCSEL